MRVQVRLLGGSLTHPPGAGLVHLRQSAQVLWYLLLLRLRDRLHVLEVGVGGVASGEPRGQRSASTGQRSAFITLGLQ